MADEALVQNIRARAILEQFSSIDQKVTQVTTAAKLIPSSNLTNRKAIFILNAEASGTYVYLGNSDVTADETVTTGGYRLNGGEHMFLTLDGSCAIYGRTSSGTTTVHTLEIA